MLAVQQVGESVLKCTQLLTTWIRVIERHPLVRHEYHILLLEHVRRHLDHLPGVTQVLVRNPALQAQQCGHRHRVQRVRSFDRAGRQRHVAERTANHLMLSFLKVTACLLYDLMKELTIIR